jgi:hypothetical protein
VISLRLRYIYNIEVRTSRLGWGFFISSRPYEKLYLFGLLLSSLAADIWD